MSQENSVQENPVQENPAREWVTNTVFRNHPALIASAMYVFASIIGMFYMWVFFSYFDINVFYYAQLGDFLLASLKVPMTWGIVFLCVFILLLDNGLSRRVQRKTGSRLRKLYGSPRYRAANFLFLFIVIAVLIWAYAMQQARQALAGNAKIVTVTYAERAAADSLVLLGTTASFVFLYDASHARVLIHPNESIHAISFNMQE